MVEFETRGRVAVLTINRPEARNAVNGEVAQAMEAGIDRLEADPALWAGVVAGTGPVFSAGADLKVIAAGRPQDLLTERGGFAGIARRERRKPLVAAVDGPALAGGCEIALACDMIVASRQAAFGLPEVKRSLVAAAGGLFRLPRALPRNVALEIALTGDPIDADRAYNLLERHPSRLGSVGARHRLPRVENRHQEVEDDVVVAIADSLYPADETVGHALQSGLLGQLTHHRLHKHLAGLHTSARD